MACNCIDIAQKKVREATGDPHAQIRGVFTTVHRGYISKEKEGWCLLCQAE